MDPSDLRYTPSHEWVAPGNPATIGITQFAQDQLGDVVFVELPEPGAQLMGGETFGSIESVKTVSDLFAPVSGMVVGVNDQLKDHPELVNSDPYGDGWLIKVMMNDQHDLDALMDRDTYEATIRH
jgi:glycine cleavage system H protein